ncbi:MAG: hypothetical protein F6K19_19095 [Cyanothece sp. SIO1E1]|nr:hypothetical protein [Cyanothece sp. SIO1E1]
MNKLFLLSLTILVGCSSYNSDETVISSEYTGLFSRAATDMVFLPSNVTLTLSDGRFEGVSSEDNYPAICAGTYEISDSKIFFTNSCAFTADFDWSYILNGEFDYEIDGDVIRISKDYGDDVIDQYILQRN